MRQHNINDFNSINEVINFQKNFSTLRQQIISNHEQLIENEKITLEAEIFAGKGLWHNIQEKKKRMGKNYRPAQEGSKDRPTPEALKKAQADDYMNQNYEWDGETEFDQNEFLKLDPSLAQILEVDEEIDAPEEQLREYKSDFLEMIVGSINSVKNYAENILNKITEDAEKKAEEIKNIFIQFQNANIGSTPCHLKYIIGDNFIFL